MYGERDNSTAFRVSADHTLILVGKDEAGHHCVCDNHGMMVASFSTREKAVSFAFAERARHAGAVVLITPSRIEH